MTRKSKKRVQAGKKAAMTRDYNRYLAREKERHETPYRYHAKRIWSGLKKGAKNARRRGWF